MTNGGDSHEAAMHARTLFEVLLRVLGVLLLVLSPTDLLSSGISIWQYVWEYASRDPWVAVYYLMPSVVQVTAGLFLLLGAPRIAAKFYPENLASAEPLRFGPIGVGDLYRIVTFGIGTVLIVVGCAFGARAAVGLMTTRRDFWSDQTILDFLIAFAIYGLSGLVLVFGSRQIGEWMATLRYDPDTIPAQQFSLRALLIVITLVGVAFAAMRYWRM